MALPGRPITIDYRISTAKLREAALSGKPQSRRNYRNIRSAPPFQNRNLDKYPMSHGREEAIRCSSGRKQSRRDLVENMHHTEADSLNLKTYSKQMFETAVKTIQQSEYPTRNRQHTCGTRSTAYGAKHKPEDESGRRSTGPTPDGSILYNPKQWMLNSIRLRPNSQPNMQYTRGRESSHPNINSSIKDKNQNFTLRSAGGISRAGSTCTAGYIYGGSICTDNSDFIFVPLCDGHENEVDRRGSLDTQTLSDYDGSCENERDLLSEIDGLDFKAFTTAVQPPVRMLPPSYNRGIHLVSLDEESSSESDDDDDEETKSDKDIEQTQAVTTTPPDIGQTNVPKGPQKPPAEDPNPATVKLILKGPHCWVDDATISTDMSDNADDLEDTERVSSASKPRDSGSRKESASIKRMNSQQHLEDAMKIAKPKPKEVPATPIKEESEEDDDLDAVFVTLENVPQRHLPTFLCPTSERKSREAAIKDWLATTCFHSASRAVPLV